MLHPVTTGNEQSSPPAPGQPKDCQPQLGMDQAVRRDITMHAPVEQPDGAEEQMMWT